MNSNKKMIDGYLAGGLLVLVLAPSIIYLITSLSDNVFRLEIIPNPAKKWIIISVLLLIGIIYAISSLVIQNTVGEGGPVELGNIEISPKTKHLVITGPYRNTRNPMLFGAFSIYLAFALFLNSITALALVCALFVFMLTVVVPMEERRLLKDFGTEYAEYRKKVSRFIPWFQRKM